MSSQEIIKNAGNAFQVNTDLSKLFLGFNNRYKNDEALNNSGYDPIALRAGLVMGRVSSSKKLVPCQPAASDGSERPIGILACDVSIDDGDTKNVSICQSGDVNKSLVYFYYGADDLNDVVDGQTVEDLLSYLGIKLIVSDELTDFDNSLP